MRLTLMLPGALVPTLLASELSAALQAPALSRVVARATPSGEWSATTEDQIPEDQWLAREVFGTHFPAPTAPYAWAELSGLKETSKTIWRADPIHVAIGRDSLFVQSLHDAPVTEPEANDLLAAANALCATEQCELQRVGADWFLLCERAWSLRPPPLSAVTGAPLPLPDVDIADSLHWSRLHNDIQMRWHAHPVNEAREARGVPVVNGLWLHGGGTWKALPRMPWARVHSHRADLRGAAHAAGASAAADDAAPDSDALMMWDDALPARSSADWSVWLEAMARIDRRIAALPGADIDLVLSGRQRLRQWRARPADRFKLWRHQSLAEALVE
jgi:hypothetical protein